MSCSAMSTPVDEIVKNRWKAAAYIAYGFGPNVAVGLTGGIVSTVLCLKDKVCELWLKHQSSNSQLKQEEKYDLKKRICEVETQYKNSQKLCKLLFISAIPVIGPTVAILLL